MESLTSHHEENTRDEGEHLSLVVAVTKEAHDVSNQQDEQTDQWEQSWAPHRHWKQTNSSTSVSKISDLSEFELLEWHAKNLDIKAY